MLKEGVVSIRLFFEDASKQSKLQGVATNIFGIFFLLIILNNLFFDWPWLTITAPYGLGVFIIIFLMFGSGKKKKEKKPDA